MRFCSPFYGLDGGLGGVGEHGEGDVPVPAGVTADFVLVQATFVLRGLEAFLDRPPDAGDPGEFVDLDADGRVSEGVGDLTGVGETAAGQHPAVMGRRIRIEDDVGGQFRRGAVIDAWALRPVAAGQLLPGIGRLRR
ncbi:hypothetical protein AB0O50_17465 [Streptomyces cyaneofuscatus]|uniref:hypothetical protein n=1 Tax=Streptomyces cyaneofuscatus TaxID=66883 RepID=UPI00343CB718